MGGQKEVGPLWATHVGPTNQPTKDPVSTQFRVLAGNVLIKQLHCDIKLKQETDTALALTKNGLSAV